MRKRKLKKVFVPVMYVMSIAMLLGSVYLIEGLIRNEIFQPSDDEVIEEVLNEYNDDEPYYYQEQNIPVVSTEVLIAKPYTNAAVQVVKNFYDYKAEQWIPQYKDLLNAIFM